MSNIICGVLKKKNKFYFCFDKESNILTIQPAKMQIHGGFFDYYFEKYSQFKSYVDLDGETNSHNYIKFINIKFSSIGRGCFQAWVPAYIEGTANVLYPIPKPNKINKIYFSGKAIDLFIQSNRIVKDREDKNNKRLSIDVDYGNDQLKSFTLNKIKYDFYPSWIRSYSKDINNILIINSRLCISTEKIMKIENVLKYYEEIEKFLCFVNYRKHIIFDKIILSQEDNIIDPFGNKEIKNIDFELHIAKPKKEYDLPKDVNVILIDNVFDNIKNLFSNVINADFLIQTLPQKKEECNIIDISKFINLSASFESEFDKLIPNYKANINEIYRTVQNNICNFINIKKDTSIKKERKYYNKILDSVEKLNGSLEEKISYAIEKYRYLIESDINYYKNYYNLSEININELAAAFSKKRNYLAHGYKMERFEKFEIISFVIIKKICYAMILERSGFDKKNIKEVVNRIL